MLAFQPPTLSPSSLPNLPAPPPQIWNLEPGNAAPGCGTRKVDVLIQKPWDYFPRFDAKGLREGEEGFWFTYRRVLQCFT